ncbi:MAG: hypothetical protein BWY75_03688 [bacterium ADurb.Bin425]|nr:MAG: hypothetical protein BWY75_03688 [bacterium ADurb.Bin425]
MDKVTLAAVVVGVLLLLLVGMFFLDAWQQFHGKVYKAPDYLIEFCRTAIQAAIGVLGFAALRGGRKAVENAKKHKLENSESGSNPESDNCSG